MSCAIAKSGPVGDEGVVEHGASVRLADLLHTPQHVGILLKVKDVDLLNFLPSVSLLVMGHVVVLHRFIKHALIHEGRIPALRPDHKGADIRHAHLEGEEHQVGLQANVFAAGQDFIFRNPDIRLCNSFLLFGNADFDIADHLHELAQGLPVIGAEFLRKAFGIGK